MEAKKKSRITLKRSAYQRPASMRQMHAHEEHELYFLVSGQRRYFIGHSIYDVSPGNLVFIPKGEFHQTTSTGKIGYDRFVLYFSESDAAPLPARIGQEAFDALLSCRCLELPSESAENVQRALEQISRQQEKKDPYSEAIICHLLQDILLTALRFGKKSLPSTAESADKIQDVAKYITLHYQMPLTLHEAAKMAYMEESYFSKRFKQLTGFGFQEFLIQNRIRAAKDLLRTTDLSITEIAFRCGFSGGNYFGDSFRKWTGISPREYRQSGREEK